MRTSRAAGLALLLLSGCACADEAIYLKSRTLRPTVGRAAPVRLASARWRGILQFRSFPGPEIRRELERRGIRVLGYVPDNGLMVASGPAASLDGLDVAWAGSLEAADKLSALLSAPAPGYLVVYFPDVDMDRARAVALQCGFGILENPHLLTGQLLVTGAAANLPALAARDEVSYILPASSDLSGGGMLMACAGPLTEAGPIAQYSTVGRGWDKDSSGGVSLRYLFQSLTSKIDQHAAQSEIERAFREWMRYASVAFASGGSPQSARTIAIQFARRAHGDGYAFDGLGGVLAHTFYPAPPNSEPIAGDMHFDADENWNAGADTDLFSVALHEAGHALGLGHSDHPGSVMYPYYRLSSGLTADDIAAIRDLYGPSGQTPITPPGTPVTPPANPPSNPPSDPSGPPSSDTTPPSLRIISPGFTIVSTSASTLALSGTASDNVAVSAVRWSVSTGAEGVASGSGNWSATAPLLVGTNVVTVRAFDAAGNSAWRAVTVVRR